MPDEPKRTALHERHVALGARTTDFAGWEMPVRYGSIIDEHRAVRESAGLFDLSHMGEVHVRGAGAAEGLASALVNDARRLTVGRAQYSLMCAPDGGIIDDLIVYRTDEESFLVVPNAANADTVASELRARTAGHEVELDDATTRTSLVAIQGPRSRELLAGLTDVELDGLRSYAAAEGRVAGRPALVARTGYTGEDGFEVFLAWEDGPAVWDALLGTGTLGEGPRPCGLGARDTLRLEAGMPLYGNELDRTTDPYEAGLGRIVRLGEGRDFVGADALRAAAARGPERVLAGLVVRGAGIARHGYRVRAEGTDVGVVTSGSHSPTLGQAIAMAYLRPDLATPGTMLEVVVRDNPVPAEVVGLPFLARPA